MGVVPTNSVGGFSTGLTMTAVIDATANITGVAGTFTGTFSGATGSFSKLLTASAGISAAGGVTLAGTLQGTTAAFTGLLSSTVGFSGSGTNLKNIVTTFNGLSGAVEGVSSVNGQTGAVTIASATNVVTSFNGATGAVTGASLGANTFTELNTFSAGISAAGSTFSSTTNTLDVIASTDGAGLRIAKATTGSFSRVGGIRLGRSGTTANNTYLESSVGIFTIYNGVDANGSKIVDFTATTTGFSGDVTATGLISAVKGISASGATFGGNISAANIVNKVNGFTGGITFAAGTGITFTASAGTITLATTGGGASTNSTTQTLDFTENINGYDLTFYGVGLDESTSFQYVENNKTIVAQFNTAGEIYDCTLDSIKSFYDPTNGWSVRVVVKPPFINTSTFIERTAQWLYDDGGFPTILYLNLTSAGGVNVLDSWDSAANQLFYHQDATYVTKTVTGQTWVTADSYIECKVLGLTTADHTPEDAILEGVKFEINNIVVGTGFDIIGHAPEGTYGKYTVKCLGQ